MNRTTNINSKQVLCNCGYKIEIQPNYVRKERNNKTLAIQQPLDDKLLANHCFSFFFFATGKNIPSSPVEEKLLKMTRTIDEVRLFFLFILLLYVQINLHS